MNNLWAFLPMRESNHLLGDPTALRQRMDEEGYLLLRGVVDPQRVRGLRAAMTTALADIGWIEGAPFTLNAAVKVPPFHEDLEEFLVGYDAIQKLEELHSLSHDEDLGALMRQVVGDTAFPHPLAIARIAFPSHYEVSTPPHQDFPNNQGTPHLTAAWIPVGDCPRDLGAIAVLRGSNRFGLLPLAPHPAAGNRQAVVPDEMYDQLRWVTTDFEAGDVLLFNSLTVHAALHNATEFNLRLSVDFRFQCEHEPLTDLVLHPHFGRLTWEEIYEGWQSDRFQYYWRDLVYEIVPFDEFDLLGTDSSTNPWTSDAETLGEAIVDGVQRGELQFSPEEWRSILELERKRDARYARRMARLTEWRDNPAR